MTHAGHNLRLYQGLGADKSGVKRHDGYLVTPELASNGLLVERGRDWMWGDQDGGAGCVGTLHKPSLVDEGFWQVQWNKTGETHIYRVGTMTTFGARAYDLQVWYG